MNGLVVDVHVFLRDKCLGLAWFATDNLPDDLIPYPGVGLRGYLDAPGGISVHGW